MVKYICVEILVCEMIFNYWSLIEAKCCLNLQSSRIFFLVSLQLAMPGQYENKDPKKCEKYGYAREQFKAWKNVLKQ